MSTRIYYKVDDDGNPVPIDKLLMPKLDLATVVPKDKETGIQEMGRDLSNIFELYEPGVNRRAVSRFKEVTNILVGEDADEPVEVDDNYSVLGKVEDGEIIYDEDLTTSGTHNVSLPAKFRDRVVFVASMWSTNGLNNFVTKGRFLKPGETTFQFGLRMRPRRSHVNYKVRVYEVEEVIGRAEGNYVRKGDLAAIFAAPDIVNGEPNSWWYLANLAPDDPEGMAVDVSGGSAVQYKYGSVYTCRYGWWRLQKNNSTYYRDAFRALKTYKDLYFRGKGSAKSYGHINFGIDPVQQQ